MKKKLSIAHLIPANRGFPVTGDAGRYLLIETLIKEQIKQGHHVTLFASSKTKFPKVKLEAIEELAPLFPDQAEAIKAQEDSTFLLLTKAFRQASRFDIIHSHLNDKHLYFAPFIKEPILITGHWPITKKLEEIIRQNPPTPNLFFTPISQAQRKSVPQELKVTQTVHNGIRIQDFTFRARPRDELAYLSRFVREKGANDAIEVARETDIFLKLAGKLDLGNDLYKKFWSQKVKPQLRSKKLKYFGEIKHKDVSAYLGSAKALLFPIKWEEPFGLVMVEAMASGTPVIAYDRGSVREIVKDGKTGFVVKNKQEMIRAVKKIDEIDRAECRRHVEKNFLSSKMAAGYEAVYQKILK
ncbi:glycosyltransferase family 4 protein [Patescibacteria group bacterium]|nr:glycosyltransferase family 4 protein [Patescibacteria group bacterium]